MWELFVNKTVAYATALAAVIALPFSAIVEGDWMSRFVVMFGAAGIAGLVIAFGRFKIMSAVARKTDAETLTNQFSVIVEKLQAQVMALTDFHDDMQKRLDLTTVTKHEALKHNQAMVWHILEIRQAVAVHNFGCNGKMELPEFKLGLLSEIFDAEDTERLKLAKKERNADGTDK